MKELHIRYFKSAALYHEAENDLDVKDFKKQKLQYEVDIYMSAERRKITRFVVTAEKLLFVEICNITIVRI